MSGRLDLEITGEDPGCLIPQHGITEPENVDRIAASMATDGWLGPPLVLDGLMLLTGRHRTAAAIRAGISVPCVQGEDLLAAAGVDAGEFRHPSNGGWTDWEQAFACLPAEIAEAYAIDL